MGESRAIGSGSNGEGHCLSYKKENGVYGEIAAIQADHVNLTQYLGGFLDIIRFIRFHSLR
jgi:hypothetical protein